MDVVFLREHVWIAIHASQHDTAPVSPGLSPSARRALLAWHRRLQAVGGRIDTLMPPVGSLEWASSASVRVQTDER
jgi:hypothetical protein